MASSAGSSRRNVVRPIALLVGLYALFSLSGWARHRAVDAPALVQEGDQASPCEADPSRCAYAILLCDDELLPALRVLLYSLAVSQTIHPVTVLALPDVSQGALEQVSALGAEVQPVQQLEYPYDGKVRFEKGINKQCRYSKLHLWNQTRYDALVYLDVDVTVQKNLDNLFRRPVWFAGVRDLGDVINTGVLVLKPSLAIFNDMIGSYMSAPSYNRGDQGFLNWYFANRTQYGIQTLPPAYNVPAKLKGFAIGKTLIKNAHVYHFTAETKPWSFHHYFHADWRVNYHPAMFASWRRMDHEVGTLMKRDFDFHALPREATPLRDQLQAYEWPNANRQYDVCRSYVPNYETHGKYPVPSKYSVAISFSNAERLQYLPRLVQHYWLSKKIDMVYITWHSPDVPIPRSLSALVTSGRLKILKQTSDSLNNRFNPIPGLRTQAVFICDDDILTTIENIDFAFEVWKNRPEALVGFFPRVHGVKEDGALFYDMAGPYHTYSMVLTKAMMVNANYLHAYTCVLPPEIHRYVDMGMNCEDIAMNMMVTGLSGAPPVCVSGAIHDFGTSRGISISPIFTHRRDSCMEALITLFGRDTLLRNSEMVTPYTKNVFYKTDWSRFGPLLDQELAA